MRIAWIEGELTAMSERERILRTELEARSSAENTFAQTLDSPDVPMAALRER
jgi:hypothetical protein